MIVLELLDVVFITGFLEATIRIATPLVFAAIGETFVERSGVLNLGCEGMMLLGAIAGFIGAYWGNLWIGLALALVAGASIALLMAFMSVTLRINQIINGIVLWIFGLGLSTYIYRAVIPIKEPTPLLTGLQPIYIPFLSDIPILGKVLFQQNALIYIALLLVIVSQVILFRTKVGLHIIAVGENPRAAETLGINVFQIRFACLLFGGAMAGLGGAFLAVGVVKTFVENMVAARGFIAVALVIFGKWRPLRVLGGALLFGGLEALQIRLLALGLDVPYQFPAMLPYILTIVVLILVARKAEAPASLCIPYKKGGD